MTTPYISVADAATYFADKMDDSLWTDATADQKDRSLATATRLMNRLNYMGIKTVITQENAFPRNTDTVVIQDIQEACAEIAYNLLDGRDPEFEMEHAHMEGGGVSSIRVSKSVEDIPAHILAGIPSSMAWSLLKPYLRNPSSIKLLRTN